MSDAANNGPLGLRPLGSVARINPESLGRDTPLNYRFNYIDISSVNQGRIDWNAVREHVFRTAPSRARRVIRPKDVMVCTVRPGLQAHAFADWSEQDGFVCSTGFAVLSAQNGFEPRFLWHVIFSEPIVAQLRRLEVGSSYPAVNESDIARLEIPDVDPTDQRRIAAVLDAVDDAICHTEALIAKLKRIRAGLLHDLLTRGIDDNGELRDPQRTLSASDAAGLPKGWIVHRMEELTLKIVDGVHKTPKYVDDGVPFLTVENLTSGAGIDLAGVRFVSLKDHRAFVLRADPRPGDVLVSKDGTLGVSRVVPEGFPDCSIFVSIAQLRPNPRLCLPELIGTFFDGSDFRRQLGSLSAGTGLRHIHLEHFRNFRVATPPIPEQERICRHVREFDNRLDEERSELQKLARIKAGLMHDLLTGKIRITSLERAR